MPVGLGGGCQWQQKSYPADRLCLIQSQGPNDLIGSLPTPPGKRFQLWTLGLFCTERHLARCLKSNIFYPFTQQQPNGAVLTARPARRDGDLNGAGVGTCPRPGAATLASRAPSPRAVFVLEYYLDALWKGTLLFVVCCFLISFGLVSQV